MNRSDYFWGLVGGWPSFFIPAALALLALTAGGCGEGETATLEARTLWVNGHAALADETALPDEDVEYLLRIRTRERSTPCEYTIGPREMSLDPDGGFSLVVHAEDLKGGATECGLKAFTTKVLRNVELDARLRPSDELCADFCSLSTESGCVAECQASTTLLGAIRVFDKARIRKSKVNSEDTLELRGNLQFDEMVESFTGSGGDHDPGGSDTGHPNDGSPTPPASGTPDFQIDASATARSIRIAEEKFSTGSCAIAENCIKGPGLRTLLKFDAVILNTGTGDFILGNPSTGDDFDYSACHGHYHLQSIAEYRLRDLDGNVVAVSRKQGFCMMDTRRYSGTGGARYDCGFQGLSAGWGDVYDSSLDCQWLDVTGVLPGTYILEVEANPTGVYKEISSTNNTIQVEVVIP